MWLLVRVRVAVAAFVVLVLVVAGAFRVVLVIVVVGAPLALLVGAEHHHRHLQTCHVVEAARLVSRGCPCRSRSSLSCSSS